MQFGALFVAKPPIATLVARAKAAEQAGFDYVWVNDNHLGHQACWPIFALIARETERVKIGPCVTNPGSRDWTETASLLATLNEISGGRAVCGIGRGDAVRRLVGKPPSTIGELQQAVAVIKELVAGREIHYNGVAVRLEWATPAELEVWGAGYGPKVLRAVGRSCDGFILQGADPAVLTWTLGHVGDGAAAAGRGSAGVKVMVGAPAYVTSDMAHAHQQLRWFAGSVANHAADLVARYGLEALPVELTGFMRERPVYDYRLKGLPNKSTDYVPDEANLRFCVIGSVEAHIAKLSHLRALGVDQFNVYFNHDAVESTMAAYAHEVIPAMRSHAPI